MNIWKNEIKKIKERIDDSGIGKIGGPVFAVSVGVLALVIVFDADVSFRKRPWLSGLASPERVGSGGLAGDSYVDLEERVIPADGIMLPVVWGDFGKQMLNAGVIDEGGFVSIYSDRGGLPDDEKKLLYGEGNGKIRMTPENSGFLLNLLWAFGLGNKNEILDSGEMMDPQFGGAGNFASTGGWTLAKGGAMNHYSKHAFVTLTREQQDLVDKVSRSIYRPCCGNSTHFPDCNHGMAMLGLLELMASQGLTESEMYKTALAVNSYWFPDTYLSIGRYLIKEGRDFDSVDPKEILGAEYSSASGYRRILSSIEPAAGRGGGGCGI